MNTSNITTPSTGNTSTMTKADTEVPPLKRVNQTDETDNIYTDETDNIYPFKDWIDKTPHIICGDTRQTYGSATRQTYGIDLPGPKESSWSSREGDACLAVLDIVNRYIKCGDTPPATLVQELMHRLDAFADLKERGL